MSRLGVRAVPARHGSPYHLKNHVTDNISIIVLIDFFFVFGMGKVLVWLQCGIFSKDKVVCAVYSYLLFLFFRSANYITLVTAQLIVMATHMVYD